MAWEPIYPMIFNDDQNAVSFSNFNVLIVKKAGGSFDTVQVF